MGLVIKQGVYPCVSACDLASVRPPYVHFKRQYHEFILYLVVSGEMELFEDGVEYHLQQNDILLLEPGKTHYGKKAMECDFYYLHFSMNEMEKEETEHREKAVFPKTYQIQEPGTIEQVFHVMEQLRQCFPKRQYLDSELADCLAQQLMLLIVRDYTGCQTMSNIPIRGKARKVMPELISFLQREYRTDITGELLQEKFHYHFDYLNRQFKVWTGKSIFHYLKEVRMERAKTLLETGYYTVEEVATQCGFQDSFYFSKVFKKQTGVTPGKWKR